MRTASIRHWLAVGLALALGACGGEDVAGPPVVTPTNSNVISSGTVTGFGSVYVNGTRYDTSGASFSDRGQASTERALKVGHRVTVEGSIENGQARARSIYKDDNVEGPIASVNAAAQTFVVLGQTVKVTAETSFDDDIAGFTALTVGLQVEVSGLIDSAGAIIATRIDDRDAGDTDLEVLGRVSALDTTARRFNINALVVDYSGASLRDFGASGLANGQLVEVEGRLFNASGALIATEVELHRSQREPRDANRELEGLITRFVSATDFDVASRPVTTTAATVYEGGTAANLALNVKVEAEGAVNAAGVLVASKIKFKRNNDAGVAGLVEAVAPDATGLGGTLTVMGVVITVDDNTRIEDKSSADIDMFRVSNVIVGNYVRVRGVETGALRLTASRLERRDPRSDVWVRGIVRDLADPRFTALGVTVVTNAGTDFEDITRANFFATGAGRIVKAKGTYSAGQLTAREVELEDSDDYDDEDGDDDDDDGDGN